MSTSPGQWALAVVVPLVGGTVLSFGIGVVTTVLDVDSY